LKTSTTNEEGAQKVVFQNDPTLVELKTIDDHATWNVFIR
jgi:hypothetical protein